jgi:hypothetical protein
MGAFYYHYIWNTSNNKVPIFLGYYFVQEQSFWSLASFCLREGVVCIILNQVAFLLNHWQLVGVYFLFMGLHFSLVVYLIMDLANFWLPIITLLEVVHDLLEKCLIITLFLFSLLKKLGWGALYFCSGALVVISPLDFY